MSELTGLPNIGKELATRLKSAGIIPFIIQNAIFVKNKYGLNI